MSFHCTLVFCGALIIFLLLWNVLHAFKENYLFEVDTTIALLFQSRDKLMAWKFVQKFFEVINNLAVRHLSASAQLFMQLAINICKWKPNISIITIWFHLDSKTILFLLYSIFNMFGLKNTKMFPSVYHLLLSLVAKSRMSSTNLFEFI